MSRSKRRSSSVSPNDIVVIYPTFGYVVDDGQSWRIPVQGAVYEPVPIGLRKRFLIRLLQRVMHASREDLESEIFQERIRGFIIGTERGKRVELKVGERSAALRRRSNSNGQFSGAIRLTQTEAERLNLSGQNGDRWFEFQAIHSSPQENFTGRAQLLPESGISVISDIDDTIKHTGAHSRRELLANTFLREFQTVDGMASLYQKWAAQGAAFHYVSASPWQLFRPLYELCESSGFPAGSFHLRSFRLRDHMLRRVLVFRRHGKSRVIRSILEKFPKRRFVLVGDSGEKDPEIYSSIAQQFPSQIASILIRDLASRPLDDARERKAFRKLPPDRWQLFRDTAEITDQVADLDRQA